MGGEHAATVKSSAARTGSRGQCIHIFILCQPFGVRTFQATSRHGKLFKHHVIHLLIVLTIEEVSEVIFELIILKLFSMDFDAF